MKKLLILTLLISPLALGQSGGSGGMQGLNQYITSEFEDVREEIKEVDEREVEYNRKETNYSERMSRGVIHEEDRESMERERQELREEGARITILKSIE